MGVASTSTEKSLRLYNGRGAYNEWTFVPVQRTLQAGAGAGAGGARPPGGAAGEAPRPGRGARGTGSAAPRPGGRVRRLPAAGTGRRRPRLQATAAPGR